ncbi:serine hydrolase domain-containing protein [Streptomyces capparidis]
MLGAAGAALPGRAYPSAGRPVVGARARRRIAEGLDALVRAGAVGALAAVARGEDEWTGTAGVADLRTGRPVPVDGRVRVGSVTKTFVAAATLRLVGEGRVRLDDPVERFLPGLVPGGEAVTVRHLLTHTSGVFSYTEDRDALPLDTERFLTDVRFRTFTPRELVGIATRHAPYFPPGGGFHYTNTGYVLLALVVEKATGRPYGEWLRHSVLRPLGLRRTTVPGTATSLPGPHPRGYLPLTVDGRAQLVDVTALNPSWAFSAGEIVSTPADLNRFFGALLGGRLLRPAELSAMREPVATDPQGVAYGMGLWSRPLRGGPRVWGHGGRIPGYRALSVHAPDGTRGVSLAYVPSTANGAAEALAADEVVEAVFAAVS